MSLLNKNGKRDTGAHEDDFMLDSGANIHCSTTAAGMQNARLNHSKVLVADKSKVTAQQKGNLPIVMEEGNAIVLLSEVRVMPNFHRNIVSLPILLSKGCSVVYANYTKIVVATKGGTALTFRRKADDLYYMRVKRTKDATKDGLVMEISENNKIDEKKDKGNDIGKVNINVLHEFLNHVGEAQIRATAKEWGLNLTGQLETCTGCARGKARQANTNKVSDKQAEHPGERLFVDLTGPFQESLTKNRYMAMAVDQKTSRIFHYFQKTKNQLEKNIAGLIEELESKGFPVKFIRMDNGGENKALIELCRVKGIVAEVTPPHTPQYNGVVERKFATIKNCSTSGTSVAGLEDDNDESVMGWSA